MSEADVFIDDVKLQDEFDLVVTLDSQEPILPSTRDMTISIPNTHGSYDYGAFFDSRVFGLSCMFKRMSYTDLKEQSRKLAKLFVDQFGRPKTVKLRFGDEPDKFYYVRLSGGVPIDRGAGVGKFTLPLVAHDPYAYLVAQNDEITWGSEEITFESTSVLFGTQGGETHTITSPKTFVETVLGYAQRPIFNIIGSGTNVTVSANGKSFSLGTFTNTNWIIDGDRYTVIKDGVNGLSSFSGDFLELIEGDNDISINGSGLNLTFECRFQDKFM